MTLCPSPRTFAGQQMPDLDFALWAEELDSPDRRVDWFNVGVWVSILVTAAGYGVFLLWITGAL